MFLQLVYSTVLVLAPLLFGVVPESIAFYYPQSHHTAAPEGYEDVWFPTTDGLTLHGWFLPAQGHSPEDTPAPTVLHVHGNTGDVSNHRFAVKFLPPQGFNVLLFDYRGFGDSDKAQGPLRRRWLVEDTDAALDYLLTRNDVDPNRIAIFGYSLGAVLGLDAAAPRKEVRAVVEYAGFATWQGVAADKAGWIGRLLISAGDDAVDAAAQLGDRPLMIVHGTHDGIVPYRHSERIRKAAQAAGVQVKFLRIEGGTHFTLGSDPVVQAAVIKFLSKSMK